MLKNRDTHKLNSVYISLVFFCIHTQYNHFEWKMYTYTHARTLRHTNLSAMSVNGERGILSGEFGESSTTQKGLLTMSRIHMRFNWKRSKKGMWCCSSEDCLNIIRINFGMKIFQNHIESVDIFLFELQLRKIRYSPLRRVCWIYCVDVYTWWVKCILAHIWKIRVYDLTFPPKFVSCIVNYHWGLFCAMVNSTIYTVKSFIVFLFHSIFFFLNCWLIASQVFFFLLRNGLSRYRLMVIICK